MSVASALRAPLAPGLRGFVQGLSDAVLVLDARLASALLANAACERLLGAAAGALPAPLERVLGSDAAQALRAASSPRGEADLALACADGRRLDAALHRLDAAHWLLRVRGGAGEGTAQR